MKYFNFSTVIVSLFPPVARYFGNRNCVSSTTRMFNGIIELLENGSINKTRNVTAQALLMMNH